MENAAWNCGSTVRPIRRSTAAVSTLSGTLPSANPTPDRKMPSASSGTEPTVGPRPMSTYAAANAAVDT